MVDRYLTRRTLLGTTAGGITVAIAGCVGGSNPSGSSQNSGDQTDEYNPDELNDPEDIAEKSFSDDAIQEIRDQAEHLEYAELMRNAEDYVGEALSDRVKVLQVQTIEDDGYQLRLSLNVDLDDIMAYWDGQRVIEDDWLDIYFLGGGRVEYETVMGNVREIPLAYIVDLEIVNDEVENG